MAKAEYIGRAFDRNGYAVHLFYRYRGHEYMVTDEHNGYSVPMAAKHKWEQDRIDKEIADAEKPKREPKYEETAQAGFDAFMEYCETGEWRD